MLSANQNVAKRLFLQDMQIKSVHSLILIDKLGVRGNVSSFEIT